MNLNQKILKDLNIFLLAMAMTGATYLSLGAGYDGW